MSCSICSAPIPFADAIESDRNEPSTSSAYKLAECVLLADDDVVAERRRPEVGECGESGVEKEADPGKKNGPIDDSDVGRSMSSRGEGGRA